MSRRNIAEFQDGPGNKIPRNTRRNTMLLQELSYKNVGKVKEIESEVTKVPFNSFSVSKMFDLANVPVRFPITNFLILQASLQLRCGNTCPILTQYSMATLGLTIVRFFKNNGTEAIGLVTPTSEHKLKQSKLVATLVHTSGDM